MPLALWAAGTVVFGAINVHDARSMAPAWGQDLAFFQQLVHSAANGGPWASPLLLEPQGFFSMVHTHLVLPLVVAAYRVVPRQETLLVFHAAMASLAFWPTFRLGERVGGRLHGLSAALALAVFAPFQGAATADFRPMVLFLAGLLGVYAAAWARQVGPMLGWAAVAVAGRQESASLLVLAGLSLCVLPWGDEPAGSLRRRWWARLRLREGLVLLLIGGLVFAAWVALKPTMFFHVNPFGHSVRPEVPLELVQRRMGFLVRLLRSGWVMGLLAPTAMLGGLPVGWGMARDLREWDLLVGPGAHYPALWLPWLVASGVVGSARLGRRLPRRLRSWGGGVLLVLLCGTAFPWVRPREGPVQLRAVAGMVGPEDRVAADYDTIHVLAGRGVLWNVEQLYLPDEQYPYGWQGDHWPLTLDDVDVLVLSANHPLVARAAGWTVAGRVGDHVVLRR